MPSPLDALVATLRDPELPERIDWQAVWEELVDLESVAEGGEKRSVAQEGWIALSLLAQELANGIEELLDPLKDTLVQLSQVKPLADSAVVSELRNSISIVDEIASDLEEKLPDVLAYLPELLERAREEVASLERRTRDEIGRMARARKTLAIAELDLGSEEGGR